jgi:hypothetical protein
LAGAIDSLLKISIAASVLIASGSISYYYMRYLPERDAQIENERKLENARTEYARQVEQSRAAAEKTADIERQAADKEATQTRYKICLKNADSNYSFAWADQCRKIADAAQKNRSECISKSTTDKSSCDLIYPKVDFNPDCSLNRAIGNDLNDQLQKSHERCLQESRLGLQ